MIIDRNCSCMNSGDRCWERLLFINEKCWSSNISWSLFGDSFIMKIGRQIQEGLLREATYWTQVTNSRGVNRREAIFMETQNLHTGSFSSPSFSPRQHSQISPAVDFPPTRKTDTWGSQFFWCKHLVKSQKQECLAGKKVRGIVHQFIFLSLWSHILDSNSWFWSKGSKNAPNSKTLVQNFAAPRGVSTSSTTDKAPQ